ncbi:D-alanyl-D-alanine carboxypeptidase [Streptomyces sp. NPDC052687]|uniref:D-alanyl-D-alanine carboxypeptidase n=1 Tax=Streptomyces sp. NPDC052687 TaxID=3154759 RepID=UPI00342B79A1
MEEASVAGESPDRSKQRESSAEPTSGSAGPVPEARSEAADPRLSVARTSVDTATRVLSTKDLAKAREDGAEGTDGTDGADGAAEDSGEDAGGKGGEDLDAAVAAWVRSADEAPSDEAASPKEGDAASAKEPEKAEESERAERADKAGRAEERDDVDEAAVAGDESEAAAEEDSDEPQDAADEGGKDSGKGATAAETAEGDKGDGDAEADSESGSESDSGAEGDEDGPEDAKGAAEETPEAAEKAEDDADASPVDQPTTVFKAVRPPKPAVDQPTTMLKLGDAAKAKPAAESGKAKETAEESGKAQKPEKDAAKDPAKDKAPAKDAGDDSAKDAARTGKFVALKPLDDPADRKPRPAAPAKPAGPVAPAKPAERTEAPAPADVTAAVPQIGPERTTQQPLPPKPPLDLLAELTNTPPPPQTPLRTAVRRVKIWTPLVLLLVIVFAVVQSFRPLPAPTLQLTAQDSYTFDGSKIDIPWPENGQAALDVQGIGTFGSSGEQKPVPIASVAKVMTAYVILRDHPLKSGEEGPMIKIDQVAEEQSQAGQESTVNVYAGDRISEREAIEGILIASANNVARLLARWDAGSEKAFVAKMNAAAKDLGMTDTTYTDPSGLNDTTVSTAVDQVKLAKAAMTQPAFREVAAMMSYDDYKGVNHPNWNQLVGSNGVVGIKTGTTTSALGNLVFAAKKEIGGETHTIVGAVVRQPAGGADNTILGAALHQSDLLIRAAQGALESATILKKGDVVGYVDDGLGGRTPVVATEDVTAVGWPGLEVKVSFAADELPHTAKAGTKVGTLTVGDGAVAGAVKVPVALERDLVEPGFTAKVTRIA